MKIAFCRVDERLLHGQVTTAWVRELSISHIFVVDDTLSNDKLGAKLMTLMVPLCVDVQILSVDQLVYMYQNKAPELEQERTMLLFRTITDVYRLLAQAGHAFDELNLGGISYRVGRQQVDKNLFLSKDEILTVQKIVCECNIRVYVQVLPCDAQVDLRSLLNFK